MRGVPTDVDESAIPECIRVADGSQTQDGRVRLLYVDVEGHCHVLTREQLEEVACVYNNWRCGNLESCMLDSSSAYGKVKL